MVRKGAKGRRKSRDETAQVLQPSSDIIDRVCDQDRRYFEKHPDHVFYVRRYVPGEFWPFDINEDSWVEVLQILPGLRKRSPCYLKKADGIDDETWGRLLREGQTIVGVSDGMEMIGEVRP